MTGTKNIIAASTTLLGAMAIAGSASALNLAAIPSTNDHNGTYYGIADYRSGIVKTDQTSTGTPQVHSASNNVGVADQNGIADYKTGTARQKMASSDGVSQIPAQNQLDAQSGTTALKTEAMTDNAVVSSDGNAVGHVEKIEPHGKFDTVYVRTADALHTTVSRFKVNVPKSDVTKDSVHLKWTVSELLNSLETQVDKHS